MADIADLALLLFLPWFLIIAALYWFYPRLLEKTPARRRFDLALLLRPMRGAIESKLVEALQRGLA